MKAVLLCAGFGTRLYPLTRDTAKPLLPVGGIPIIEHLVVQLDGTGLIDEFLVVANHRVAAQFRQWRLAAESRAHASIVVLDDGVERPEQRLGAVGDLAWVTRERALGTESILVAAGDNLFRADLRAFLEDHRAHPRNLVLRYREPDADRLRRTAVAEVDAGGRLLRLVEKPQAPPGPWAVPALYVLEPGALALLDAFVTECPTVDAIGHFIAWLAAREPVFAREMWGQRLDVGDLASYRTADAWLAEGGCT